jgi:hypothetical protein
MPDSVTVIQASGPPGTKKNIAVLGDGFAEADQTVYNDLVDALLLEGVFGHDYFYEDKQAFNIYRVNLISNDSGVNQRVYDEMGTPSDSSDDVLVSETLLDTALGYIYSGSWAHCWLENGANTAILVQNALDTWVPDYHYVLVILNETGFGGCGGGGFQIVTRGSSWTVMAHEFGHGVGGLADEYCQPGTYAGSEPGAVNVTANSNPVTLKWRRLVSPMTPVPTGVNANPGNGACTNWNQGDLFEGAQYKDKGKYRPVENCRMRGNWPPFCPVCYTSLKEKMYAYTGHNFNHCYAGDFNGDGRDDLLVHADRSIMIFRSDGSQLDLVFNTMNRVPGSWDFRPNDKFHIGDFNGDGKDEIVVYNSIDWDEEYLGLLVDDGKDGLELGARFDDSISGWTFNEYDRFYSADFDGDGMKDLYVFNGKDWGIPYLGMIRSTGTSFEMVERYDGEMPGWTMRQNDRLAVGDFTGDGREDLWPFNGDDWLISYLAIQRSTGSALEQVIRYDGALPGWTLKKGDRLYVGDFDGDGRADLYSFNGANWAISYLSMLRSTGTDLALVRRYNGNLLDWSMSSNDRHFLADIDGDGRADLFVYNHENWPDEFLGAMISDGISLSVDWKQDVVGEWNLGTVDQFVPCDYEGVGGKRDLFVHNAEWFGMIRAIPEIILQNIYFRWIHNYRFGRNW